LTSPRVLVIDDEAPIRRLLKVALEAHGYQVQQAATGLQGLEAAAFFRPDIIILDLGLPDMDGLEVIKRLREWTAAPIIVLSVREQEGDKIKALDGGADDYVVKPFGMGELLARMRAALRHASKSSNTPVVKVGNLTIDMARRQVKMGDREIKLTPTEYELLKHLALNAGKVLTHRQLLRSVWGPECQEEIHYLRVYIGQLRRKLEPDPARPRYIITEPGVGYRLEG